MSKDRSCQCAQAPGACNTEFQYAVKVVCGTVHGCDADGSDTHAPSPMAPGRYWSAVNIHNPDKCRDARFRWKFAVAAPLGSGVPPLVTGFRPLVLGPDAALEIDCDYIMKTLPAGMGAFVKGYVVLESDIELDVVAVYSAAQGSNAGVSSFHTERVQPRCVPVCEDLIVPLHTGLADWQTVAPTPGPLGPVALVTAYTSWVAPPAGAAWVSQASTDGAGANVGIRHYELCFTLCSGFTRPPPLLLQMAVDDEAMVFLNNSPPLATIAGPGYIGLHSVALNPTYLQAGRNCLRIEVSNSGGGPTGFVLAGILRVARGRCPCTALPLVAARSGPADTADPDGEQAIEPAPIGHA